MKKIQLSFLFAVLLLQVGCKKKDVKPVASLKLTFVDELGKAVPSASVSLYPTQTDWENSTNKVGSTLLTDATGNVTFSDLPETTYFWYGSKDCMNNYNSTNTSSGPLELGKTNTITTSNVLQKTGTLIFVNNSSNPFKVYLNGEYAFQISGNSTKNVYNKRIGHYTIRVIQTSGYIASPIDSEYTGDVTCSGSLRTTFPY